MLLCRCHVLDTVLALDLVNFDFSISLFRAAVAIFFLQAPNKFHFIPRMVECRLTVGQRATRRVYVLHSAQSQQMYQYL